MDKGFTSFFKFVYKILRFILMLPIKIVKLFCEGFFYTFYVFSEIIFYAILFPSFLVYKIFKYLIYSLSLPVMIANTIKRRKVFKVKKLDKDSEIVHIPDNAMEKIEKYNREHNRRCFCCKHKADNSHSVIVNLFFVSHFCVANKNTKK